jgi:hypothetical protein
MYRNRFVQEILVIAGLSIFPRVYVLLLPD